MCGENTNNLDWPQIHALFRLTLPKEGTRPRLESDQRPGSWGLVIRYNPATQERSADLLLWGLLPNWARDPAQFQKTYNARAENLTERRCWIEPFRRRRCLIPAAAFIERKTIGRQGRGTKHAFSFADGSPMTLAGLWDGWRSPGGMWVKSYTVITVEPNPVVAEVHDRMPAILPPEHWSAWLGETPATEAELKAMLRPYPDCDRMVSRPIQLPDRGMSNRDLLDALRPELAA